MCPEQFVAEGLEMSDQKEIMSSGVIIPCTVISSI